MMGLIRRSFSFLDNHLFRKLYITFVRPHLEYAQAVWAPHLAKHINMLENVQERATRLVDGLHNVDYPNRLQFLDLPTLAYRRARGDMIELWKHFHTYEQSTFPSRSNPDHELYDDTSYNYSTTSPRMGFEESSEIHSITGLWTYGIDYQRRSQNPRASTISRTTWTIIRITFHPNTVSQRAVRRGGISHLET